MQPLAQTKSPHQEPAQNDIAPSIEELQYASEFIDRHIGPSNEQIAIMLASLKLESLEQLIKTVVPSEILTTTHSLIGNSLTESQAIKKLKDIASLNKTSRSFIGLGYYSTRTPSVISRNVLQNPGWYTAYTPYQPEISQGRLECLLNFQQMVIDLTAMDIANASLLDEATAAAEAMALAKRVSKNRKSNKFFVHSQCFPQTIDVLRTRAECFGFELVIGEIDEINPTEIFGGLFQYPAMEGSIQDFAEVIEALHTNKAIAVMAADIMALALLKPPGEMGADVVVGNTQRFGVPLGYGGPHAAYFATKEEYKRAVPGRIIGVSVDAKGKRAYRMALQTREQHIRREKANSNICTAQVLLANIAGLYATYHGPQGIHKIASRIHRFTSILAMGLEKCGINIVNENFFDTLTIKVEADEAELILKRANDAQINLWAGQIKEKGTISISLDECTNESEIRELWSILIGPSKHSNSVLDFDEIIRSGQIEPVIPEYLNRNSKFLTHPVFNSFHSETDMMRYLKRLENKDISLTHSMIPLGSCTMKLNAASEMIPISWPEFSDPHPFSPLDQVSGYQKMIAELEHMLAQITGFDAISMQPNSGAQGEFAGLLAIKKYLQSIGHTERKICLIPTSAHGTNPASAQMIGMKVVLVSCDERGNIDVDDLENKVREHGNELAALMITYPSTHGVYEAKIKTICKLVHEYGGQVYMDGANLNAQVEVARPAEIGADVSHVNLHKTFCIPHGGGGPGMGPIGVKSHLAPFLANHSLIKISGPDLSNSAVSAAPWGSGGILPISWMYITMMGREGLRKATQVAILSANYIAKKLESHYPILYKGQNDMVAHECIIDIRPFKQSSGISEEDIAKRLIDYGFHAPTMSFPVPGTLMIEPTESESLEELDRFIDAMVKIRGEIQQIETGALDSENNPLKNAPHTLKDIVDDNWDRPYSIAEACYPADKNPATKYWPTVNRIDNVYGDRNLFCACPPIESFKSD
tara:strand:+ start:2136 stop:5099 length:2964 start_codon:yes stop_codon:yes gene_type:complete